MISRSEPRGTVVEYGGMKFVAADDEILGLLSDAAIFEKVGSASVRTAVGVALGCGRLIPKFLTERP